MLSGKVFPIVSHLSRKKPTPQSGFNLGGTNATGQIPSMPGNRGVIDVDTPKEAYTKASYMNQNDMWDLVFSDEFQVEGRSFYPGDDPYWEAPNLHYWGTVSGGRVYRLYGTKNVDRMIWNGTIQAK